MIKIEVNEIKSLANEKKKKSSDDSMILSIRSEINKNTIIK